MQYAPDVNLLRTFDIKNQTGKASALSESQTWQIELMRIARRADSRTLLNLAVGLLKRINKWQGNFRRMLQIIFDRFLNIQVCPLVANKRFHLLSFRRWLIPERNPAK